ncbi:hypothetical protein HYPSUDRAFT_145314 [Hypholoma sublateritium FD-334 SS-4]|uniref:Protein-S-isoprenylcysteine O-methyltransferase n=1 Tax=Hypholoma sublateritium (strain FD-334 SS-4) TaxID=945553 RepID=A0A0D2KUC1_HYPSF|nr:hypothetical protein HYPSUDRAFT_145314 [Hypholoma sublateritium FD-334 SS-4]
MSLLRIPFSLSVTWAIHTMFTAPTPPAQSAERVGSVGLEVYLIPRIIKTCFYLSGAAEVLSILANAYPDSIPSHLISAALNRKSPPTNIAITRSFLVAWVCCITGTLIRRQCYKALGKSFTFEISLKKDHRLVTSGPYAFVRHPAYSSGALGFFGALSCHTTPGAWLLECSGVLQPPWDGPLIALGWLAGAASFVLTMVPRLNREDAIMKGYFEAQWDAWAAKVPYSLIPGIY